MNIEMQRDTKVKTETCFRAFCNEAEYCLMGKGDLILYVCKTHKSLAQQLLDNLYRFTKKDCSINNASAALVCQICNKEIKMEHDFDKDSSGKLAHKYCLPGVSGKKKCYQCGIELVSGMLHITTGVERQMLCRNCWGTAKFDKEPIRSYTLLSDKDDVNNPSHYNQGKIEVIEFIKDQKLDYHAGNVVKYVCRYKHKGQALKDLKKAQWYLNDLIMELKSIEYSEKEEREEKVK